MGRNITFHLKSKYPQYLFLILSLSIFFPIFLGKSLYFRDFYNFHYPLWDFVQKSLKSGIFPLWNPYLAGGQMAGGNSNYLIFYPISILVKLLPFNSLTNMNLFLFIHHYLGTLFFYYLLRKLNFSKSISFLGGLIYSLSGVILSLFVILNYVPYMAIFPLFGILLIKLLNSKSIRIIFYFSLFLGISLTLFEPLFFFSLFLFLTSIYLLHHKKELKIKNFFLFLILIFILSISIASPFLNEAYSLYKNSYRGKEGNTISSKLYDTHPLFLKNFFISNIFNIDFKKEKFSRYSGGKLLNGKMPFFLSIFLGIIPFYFALYTLFLKRKKLYYLWLLFLFSTILSMGHYIKFIPEIFSHFPLLSNARYFSKFLICSEIILILLAIYGLKIYVEEKGRKWVYPFSILIPILIISFKMEYGFYISLIFTTFLIFFSLFYRKKSEKLIISFIFLELILGNSFLLQFAPIKDLTKKSEVLSYITKNYPQKVNYYIAFNPHMYSISSKRGKLLLDDYIISKKCGIAFYGITEGFHYIFNATLDKLESPYSVNYYKFLKKINAFERNVIFKKSGVKFFLSPVNFNINGYKLIKKFDVGGDYKIYLYEIENSSGRFKISHNYVFSKVSELNLYKIIRSEDVIECNSRFKFIKPIGYERKEYVKILNETPNKITLLVNFVKEGFLIFNTTYSPKWKVKVNEIPVKKCKVNYGFQGIFLKRGKYKVLFYYDYKRTEILFFISILTLLFFSLLIWGFKKI